VTALSLSLTDSTGSSSDIARVRLYKDTGAHRAAAE
jgi:hypothetical protein